MSSTSEYIQKTIHYIESHLDDELTVEVLAKEAGYSRFHFSRAFKLEVGESVISYIARLRVERSALHVNMNNSSLIEVAQDAGYKTPTGFLKAFKKRFGSTPSDYKNNTKDLIYEYRDMTIEEPQITTRDNSHILYVRKIGGYETSTEDAWESLMQSIQSLPSLDLTQLIGICYDDPEISVEDTIRYEAAIVLTPDTIKPLQDQEFNTKMLFGGRYVKTLFNEEFGDMDETYNAIYLWIKENNYNLRDAPAIEHYLSSPLITYINIPIH